MFVRCAVIFLGLLLPFQPVSADEAISPEAMRAHVEMLASDRLEGRDTGSSGYDRAAKYVAEQLSAMGVKPANGSEWYQPVPLATAMLDFKKSRFLINRQNFQNRSEVLYGPARKAGFDAVEGDVVFAGYGIYDPANKQNDYRGLNVRGKIVALLHGYPKGMKSDIGAHYGRAKIEMAQQLGAKSVIIIRTKERERVLPWSRQIEGPPQPGMGWTLPDGQIFSEAPNILAVVTLGDKAAEALFAGARTKLSTILAQADRKGGRPKGFALKSRIRVDRTTTISTISSPNVVGIIPGSDPQLSNEVVLLMAHLDHKGIDATKKGDQIFNGAMDNASGMASLLEAARALAKGPQPKRTIMFAAVTAEERGLLGSDYLARNPLGGRKVVSAIALDMPILLYDFLDVIAFGAEHSTMGPATARAAAKLGVAMSPDPLPSEGLFTRSDHYSFVRQGVPSIFLMTGFKNGGEQAFQDFLKTHYHQVSDDLKLPFNWAAAAKFAQVNMMIASELANAPDAPKWYSDSFFGQVFAPKATKAAR